MDFYAEALPFEYDGITRRVNRIKKINAAIDSLPEVEASPSDLARKVTLLNTMQGVIGELYSQAVYDYGIAYNMRKEKQAMYERSYYGTIKEKEAYAEENIKKERTAEVRAESEMKRWEKAYNSTEMLANAIKHELSVLSDEMRAGGRT